MICPSAATEQPTIFLPLFFFYLLICFFFFFFLFFFLLFSICFCFVFFFFGFRVNFFFTFCLFIIIVVIIISCLSRQIIGRINLDLSFYYFIFSRFNYQEGNSEIIKNKIEERLNKSKLVLFFFLSLEKWAALACECKTRRWKKKKERKKKTYNTCVQAWFDTIKLGRID